MQMYVYEPPILSCRLPVDTQTSLDVYHATMWNAEQYRQHQLVTYYDDFSDHISRWKHSLSRLEVFRCETN